MPKKEKAAEERLAVQTSAVPTSLDGKQAIHQTAAKKAVEFWPFDNYKDGVKRHWEWLRRWLLANIRGGVAILVIVFIAVSLIITMDNWLPALKELPGKYIQPATNLDTGNIDRLKVELTPTEVVTRSFETTVKDEVFGGSNQATLHEGGAKPKPVDKGSDSAGFSKPIEGELAVAYGLAYSPIYQDYRFHDGIDILSTKDDGVKAVLDGKVADIFRDDAEGLVIVVDHAQKYRSVYGHIGKPEVSIGQQVQKGQVIGNVEAEKGILHFSLKKGQQGLNPLQYFSY